MLRRLSVVEERCCCSKGSTTPPGAPLPVLKPPEEIWSGDEAIGPDESERADDSMPGEMLSDGDVDGLAGAPG